MSQVQELKKQLELKTILMDGAMGTYYDRIHPDEGEVELANLQHPKWVQEIHRRYIEAGARLIRANTFAINHILFAKREDISAALRAAVANACQAVTDLRNNGDLAQEEKVWVAGSLAPIRVNANKDEENVIEEYWFICDTLLAEGIRIFIFETFGDTRLVLPVAEYLREKSRERYGEEVFVLAQFSVNRMGYTQYGYSMKWLVRELEQMSVLDGFGFNCGIGAAHMNKLFAGLHFTKDTYVSVLPNAGYEHMQSGRQVLIDNPAYYASVMERLLDQGVNLIGGCCGTNPAYIKALSQILKKRKAPAAKKKEKNISTQVREEHPSPFIEKLSRGERVYVVEIDSPFDQHADKFLEAAYRLKENAVDLVTISDSPMARSRAEAFEMGIYIRNQTGVNVMPHVCCRDRNLIALRSAILGGYINGIRDVLIITGDPVARDDRNSITGVFDMNSIQLMEYMKNLNQETFREQPVYYGGALNYAGINIEAIANRMKKKMEAGCSYFLTQPVYSDADIERVRELKCRTGAKIILGIMPLVSLKNALFMKNELPGISVPEEIISQYQADMSREEAEEAATRISVEIGRKAADFADGLYFMTPFNRVSLINGIIDRLRERK